MLWFNALLSAIITKCHQGSTNHVLAYWFIKVPLAGFFLFWGMHKNLRFFYLQGAARSYHSWFEVRYLFSIRTGKTSQYVRLRAWRRPAFHRGKVRWKWVLFCRIFHKKIGVLLCFILYIIGIIFDIAKCFVCKYKKVAGLSRRREKAFFNKLFSQTLWMGRNKGSNHDISLTS